MILHFEELTFETGHYIPNHPKCGCIHGHTYRLKDLQIEMTGMASIVRKYGMFVDFGVIKGYFKENWNHKFYVPEKDIEVWEEVWPTLKEKLNLIWNLRSILHTTDEWMAVVMQQELTEAIEAALPERMATSPEVHFALYEGDNQGVIV